MKNKSNPQTVVAKKYQKKVGYVSKSYKLKQETVKAFRKACEKERVFQSVKLSELMISFIEEINNTIK